MICGAVPRSCRTSEIWKGVDLEGCLREAGKALPGEPPTARGPSNELATFPGARLTLSQQERALLSSPGVFLCVHIDCKAINHRPAKLPAGIWEGPSQNGVFFFQV